MTQDAIVRPGNPWRELTPAALRANAACWIGYMLSSAPVVNATFGVFLVPVTREMGWSRTSFAVILTMLSVIGMVSFPLAGRLADRIGVRRVVLGGNLAFGASVAAIGLGRGLPSFYLLYAIVGVAMAFPSGVMMSRVVAGWYVQRRGFMLGVTASLGNSIGYAAMPLIMLAIVTRYGWRDGYHALGAIVVLVGFPVFWLLLRERDRRSTRGEDRPIPAGLSAAEARRTRRFWLLLAAVAIGAGTMTAILTHVVPIVLDRGFSPQAAGVAVTGTVIGSLLWQLAFGRLLDALHTPRFAAIAVMTALGGLLLLARGQNPALLFAGGMLTGVAIGTEYGLLPYVIPRYFGFRAYGEIYGTIFGTALLVGGVAPVLMDVVFDRVGSYEPAMIANGVILLVSAAIIAALPGYRFAKDPGAGPADGGRGG